MFCFFGGEIFAFISNCFGWGECWVWGYFDGINLVLDTLQIWLSSVHNFLLWDTSVLLWKRNWPSLQNKLRFPKTSQCATLSYFQTGFIFHVAYLSTCRHNRWWKSQHTVFWPHQENSIDCRSLWGVPGEEHKAKTLGIVVSNMEILKQTSHDPPWR